MFFLYITIKDLYSRKDSNLVFSRFISRGKVICYNRAKINCLENSQENQPITPTFVLYIVYILHYTKQSLHLSIQVQWKKKMIFFLYHPSYTSNKTKVQQSFIYLKHTKNDKTKKPITPSFVLYIEYTFIHFGMLISCKQGNLLISKQDTPISAQNTPILTNDGKQSLINTNREHCFQ